MPDRPAVPAPITWDRLGMYPDGLWPSDYCYMEGHIFRDGGACVRCGERLRCYACGQYMTLSDESIRKHAHMPCSPDCEGCDLCMEEARDAWPSCP